MIFENIDICKGNPGAAAFLMDAYKTDYIGAEKAFLRMRNNNITGDKLYMIWNDCCDRNTKKAIHIINNHTIEDILKHINYENGRGIRYSEEEVSTKPFSKKYLLDDVMCISSRHKHYKGYVALDTKCIPKIEQAEDILIEKCVSVIKEILKENKETFLHIEEDKSHPNCLIGCWQIFLPTINENND